MISDVGIKLTDSTLALTSEFTIKGDFGLYLKLSVEDVIYASLLINHYKLTSEAVSFISRYMYPLDERLKLLHIAYIS